ncbi:Ring-h2 finger protein atl57 [Thalictrum thalictroides]|uniref:RING-type E3 ubiquitin transferase n=1 Tax=Thalictrum thalictroides TaxID=46969 RepID=A0A7J6V0Y7_THATH|nr:Ring-h2 finger protein atl57 [Thalictrum thalictroides]
MALTMLILLIALFFMGFFSVYLRNCDEDSRGAIRRRQRQQRRRSAEAAATSSSAASRISSGTSHGVDPLIVRSLPLVAYEKFEKEPFDCVVCLCEFEERETVKMIPHCRHVFHPECIDKWFSSHDSCPLCRSIQLLRLPSHKEDQNRSFNVVEERLTVEDVDTCVEGQREEDDFWRIRRTSSWSSGFGERVCLQRSLSM